MQITRQCTQLYGGILALGWQSLCGTGPTVPPVGDTRNAENRRTRGKGPVPTPLCLPQIPHGLKWVRSQASAVKNRRLATSAMAWPNHYTFPATGRRQVKKCYAQMQNCADTRDPFWYNSLYDWFRRLLKRSKQTVSTNAAQRCHSSGGQNSLAGQSTWWTRGTGTRSPPQVLRLSCRIAAPWALSGRSSIGAVSPHRTQNAEHTSRNQLFTGYRRFLSVKLLVLHSDFSHNNLYWQKLNWRWLFSGMLRRVS
jgi:hypothetical protein